jgi:hypothetical protein
LEHCFQLCGHDSAILVEWFHAEDSFKVVVRRTMPKLNFEMKEEYLHILLHIYEDFDDDLLQEAIELLV